MANILWRIALVVGGGFVLVANSMGGSEGTFLGFYPFASAEMIGFNVAKLAIAALALWFIYSPPRGLSSVLSGVHHD